MHVYTPNDPYFGATPESEFTPVYNGVVRALLTPDDYNQQPFRETTLQGEYARCFTFRLSDASRHVTAITALFVGTYATV